MGEIIEAAKKEFLGLQTSMKTLYGAFGRAVVDIKDRLDNLEKSQGKSGSGMEGHIPMKSLVPGVFMDKAEDWRQLQDDAMDYFDNVNLWMKEFLKEVEAETDVVDEAWLLDGQDRHTAKITSDELHVWRMLKNLTNGEARKVVTSIKTENGFRAWQKLHMRFGPSLASKQGMVLMEFSAMMARPAKTQDETRSLAMEMERRIKLVEDVTGEEVSENHVKLVLVGILDPMTREHTAMYRGSKASHEQLKKVVLEFTNDVACGLDSVQIGALHVQGHDFGGEQPHHHDDVEHEHFVGALGKGIQRYACHGY
jgi:hypothetical protein